MTFKPGDLKCGDLVEWEVEGSGIKYFLILAVCEVMVNYSIADFFSLDENTLHPGGTFFNSCNTIISSLPLEQNSANITTTLCHT